MDGEDAGDEEEWDGIKEDGTETDVVKSLIAQAKAPVEKRVRHLSEREVEWLKRLVERHGDDYQAMFRDRALNPMQQTAADIRRRIEKMNA
jgi:nucleolar protein 16